MCVCAGVWVRVMGAVIVAVVSGHHPRAVSLARHVPIDVETLQSGDRVGA